MWVHQIDGWTQPSVQDLRQLIVKHGGTFHAYLDRKAIVYVSYIYQATTALTFYFS